MNMQQVPDYENDKDILAKFGRNINEEVKKGKIDPVIGRDEEIRKIINSLEDKSVPNVMKHFKTNYAGQVDMSLVNSVLRSL